MDGMEVIAFAVVIALFYVVLKQFGIWGPLSLDGKRQGQKTCYFRPSLDLGKPTEMSSY